MCIESMVRKQQMWNAGESNASAHTEKGKEQTCLIRETNEQVILFC